MTTPRWRAPTSHGAQLADPAMQLWPQLARRQFDMLNDCFARIGSSTVAELRASLRTRLNLPDVPIIVTGHQPELYHPGVWVKNFATAKAAKSCGGFALNLVADHDTLKSRAISVVHQDADPNRVSLESVPFDQPGPEMPWELATVNDDAKWTEFANRVCQVAKTWNFTPMLLQREWPKPRGTWGAHLTAMRRTVEQGLGLNIRDEAVSVLSRTPEFVEFVQEVHRDLPWFREVYNQAIQAYRVRHKLRSNTHPAPQLSENESPFWAVTSTGRAVSTTDTPLSAFRPRALTLTLFARLMLGDLFVHGLGGAKYDEVTDDVMRHWLGIDPPRYAVLSATALLPFDRFDASTQQLQHMQRQLRELDWQPERHGAGPAELVQQKQEWIARPSANRTARQERFQQLNSTNKALRTSVSRTVKEAEEQRLLRELAANAKLARRDFAWVLHPEESLMPFLRAYLE
jgi:hypothetical protein